MIRLAVLLAALAAPAWAESNAARWLAEEAIGEACPNGGVFSPAGLVEIDLNADGRDDLVMNHEEITCAGDWSRSSFCGTQACAIVLFLRDENGLLVLTDEAHGAMLSIGTDSPPTLKGFAHGGTPWAIRWSGTRFELQ